MATLPYRTASGNGALPPGLFGHPGPFQGVTPQQTGVQNRPVVGWGLGHHPFYSTVAYHQSRAYRLRSGRPGAGSPFQPRPPYNGGNPPRPLPPPRPPVFPGPQPVGPQLPPTFDNGNGGPFEQPIYYQPQPVHPAVLAAQMGLLG